jgi:hypothetical protein
MIKPIKKFVWNSLNRVGLGGSIQLYLESILKDNGWFRSYHTKRSVDAEGNPLPWYTYPFIHFITPRIKPHFEAFEYGSGNSTKWYAAKIKGITAVEHDKKWVEIVKLGLPANAEVLYRDLGKEYIEAISEKNKKYHIVIVDGRKRVKCSIFASDYLTPDGVLILDNSEREFYNEAKEYMKNKGFRRIDFYGMAPIVSHETCTSVFYRADNCLEI